MEFLAWIALVGLVVLKEEKNVCWGKDGRRIRPLEKSYDVVGKLVFYRRYLYAPRMDERKKGGKKDTLRLRLWSKLKERKERKGEKRRLTEVVFLDEIEKQK